MGDIQYPAGCKPVTEDLGSDELIRRLKLLTSTLQTMGQEEGAYQAYIPLALHLADEYFLQHPSRDVQLLIACCIADVLRVYAPEAPYKDAVQVKGIFNFIVSQLNGLRDPKDTSFKRYFYLLENLAYVKSFNMCFDIEDCQEILCNLFGLLFRIVSDEHSSKVKCFMLDVLSPLITEADNVSTQLLDIILINIVEPHKSTRKNAYGLARDLIKKTHDTLEQYIVQFFNQVLIMDNKADRKFAISAKVYDLIYELNVICPSILLGVLPQLECKLKAGQETERLKAVALLALMFSERNSTLASVHKQLWRTFLSRFCDIAVPIRIKCVQSSMHFLLNHPDLRPEIIETLKLRQHDTDETVRYEVVMAIVETSKRDFQVVSESEDLLEYVKERTLDKKLKIRKEAMNGLGMIYKTYLLEAKVPEATRKAVVWIKDKILHGYYMTGIEDRLLVERLLITCLVPYNMPPEERMKKLYRLMGTIDDNATKAFIELQKSQMKVRKMVTDWVKMHRLREPSAKLLKDMNTKCTTISKQLPDPLKAHEFLLKFSSHLRKDAGLLADMEKILNRDVSCQECAETLQSLLKKLGQPIMTNLYYNTVKMLLERIASVMVDRESIEILVILVAECMQGGNAIAEIGMPAESVGQRGLKMLSVLAFVFSAHFQHDSILRHMLGLLSFEDEYVAPYILKAFTYLGRYLPLSDAQGSHAVLEELIPICKALASNGTPKQAKHAIRCMFVNMGLGPVAASSGGTADSASASTSGAASSESAPAGLILRMFGELVESFRLLQPEQSNYRTSIVAIGHIAYNLPDHFQLPIKNIVARKIVRDLLVRDPLKATAASGGAAEEQLGSFAEDEEKRAVLRARVGTEALWCLEEELPEETRCKVEGLKAMARWLIGLRKDVMSAQKTFRMLNAFMRQRGDLLASGKLAPAEMSWLRLSAGTAMLKICEVKGVGDQYSAEQFYVLANLMIDPVFQVRERFAKKLHKGLNKGIPLKCLPLDFMGLYALAGRETNKTLLQTIRTSIDTDVSRRRDYIKSFAGVQRAMSSLPNLLPDYMLVFAIAVLTHDPDFTDPRDLGQLKAIERCLWLVLEPLISNRDFFCFGFYENIVDRIKHHKDALKPDDAQTNAKMWAICDIAKHLTYTKASNHDARDFPVDARLPSMLFEAQPEDFSNTEYYLPAEMYKASNSVGGSGLLKRPLPREKQQSSSTTTTTSTTLNVINTKDTSNEGTGNNDDDDETRNNGSGQQDQDDDQNAFSESAALSKRPRIASRNALV